MKVNNIQYKIPNLVSPVLFSQLLRGVFYKFSSMIVDLPVSPVSSVRFALCFGVILFGVILLLYKYV